MATSISSSSSTPSSKPSFSLDQVQQRVEAGEILVVFKNKVYCLTKWAQRHPGGELAIKHMNGKDATDVILAYHPEWVMENKMPYFCIGDLSPDSIRHNKLSQSYRQLMAKLKSLHLFTTDYSFYVRETLKFVGLWALVVYLVLAHPGSGWYVGASAFLCAAMWHQAAFVAHDAGHTGITHDQWTDTVLGITLGNFLGGISLGWWKKSHNVHHIITNHPEHDPDIQHLPFIAVSPVFLNNIYSSFYKRTLEFDTLAKICVPLQHYLFYILLCFGRFNLYANSLAYVSAKEKVPHRLFEISGLIFFGCWYGLLLSHCESWSLVALHVMVSHVLTVLLHIQITLSHFGMDTSIVENETYAEMALRTTMDIDCPRWLDWFHGGLQFQVEHHLFPRIPRHNLRKVQPLVEEFAKENGLAFHRFKFLKGNWFVLNVLAKVAGQVADALKGSSSSSLTGSIGKKKE